MDVDDKAAPEREGSRVRFETQSKEYKIHSDSESDDGWKTVKRRRAASLGRARGGDAASRATSAGARSAATDSDGEGPAVNPKKLWVKGNSRQMNGDTLKIQGKRCVEAVNARLMDGERKFELDKNPAVFGFDLSTSASLLFESEEEAERFYVSSRELELMHDDGPRGKYPLRVNKDTAFDVRLRNQVFWHLKNEVTNSLKGHEKWIQLGDAVKVKDTGRRGAVFIDAGGGLSMLFVVSVSQKKGRDVLRPIYENLNPWGMDVKEADILVNRMLKMATLFDRRI